MTIQELIEKYPNNYELGEAVRKIHEDSKSKKIFQGFADSEMGSRLYDFCKLDTNAVEKDYEILSIIKDGRIHSADTCGKAIFDNITSDKIRFEGENNWEIHSVKRLSDGIVFSIGDYVKFPIIEGNITAITEHYIAIHDVSTRISNVSHQYP